MNGFPLDFESPSALLLLLAIPFVVLGLRWSLADSSRAQLIASAAIRSIILALIVFSLAGTLHVGRSSEVAVLVLGDLSDSVPENAPDQLCELLAEVEAHATNPERAGLAVFAERPDVTVPVQARPEFPDELQKPEDASDTRIGDALLMARETLPSDAIRRVVLMSDGNDTQGGAVQAAKLCASRGIRVYTVPYETEERPEVLLEDLIVPAEVKRGQSFAVQAVAHSSTEGQAEFALYRNGFKIDERTVDLKEGSNTLTFQENNPADGLSKYELRVRAQDDYFADNNVSTGIVFVSGEPRILLLEGEEREARHLARALEAENIRVDFREGKGMPGTLEEMAAFDAIILSDVPATDVSVQQMNLLRSYIEDLGGGFIMIGGEESFGLGGYYRTAIEDALPVRMKSEKKKDTPSLAMMLIIDKSGSMNGEKIQLAKEAAIATVELLGAKDYIGVIAFDGDAYWAVDLQSASNSMGIVQTIELIEAGGGTNIYPGLAEAYDALTRVSATFKHAVVLTDGHSQPGDFAGIVDRMAAELITVSSVGIGEGADNTLLQDIARWGRGRHYFTADPYDIPQIFTKETMQASKSSLVEEPFLAQLVNRNQVVQAIDWDTAPFLFGYVVTTPKSTADVILVTERGDPLLASWRVGLGKAVAFTSDAKSRWASDWLGWPGYGVFWAQIIRDTMRTTESGGAETTIEYTGNEGRIIVDNVDPNGNFINQLNARVQVIDPDLEMTELELQQTAPGRYESAFPMNATGSYLLKVNETAGEEAATVADFTRGFSVSYKAEYRHLGTNEDALREIAEVTGGKYQPNVSELFAVDPNESVPIRRRLWPWLLGIALCLFLMDVALRRLDLAGRGVFGKPDRYG
jgi:Ca-activated chloride channel homolog